MLLVRDDDGGKSEIPGVPVIFGGHNLLPLVEIGLTDLPKFGSLEEGRSLISAYRSLAITTNTSGFKKLSTALYHDSLSFPCLSNAK